MYRTHLNRTARIGPSCAPPIVAWSSVGRAREAGDGPATPPRSRRGAGPIIVAASSWGGARGARRCDAGGDLTDLSRRVRVPCRTTTDYLLSSLGPSARTTDVMAGHSWRSLLFGVEGWRHFLKSGYAARAKHFDDAPFARDLRGTHVVVTGANQGIGFQVAKQLALQRASVHMVCRSEERGEKALRALKEEVAAANADGSPPDVTLDVCDVSDAKAVRAFARAYVESGRPLHCLVNNAGCMVHERTLTPEGVETNFATNTLGTYALTEGLLPSLERTAAREKARDDPSFRQRCLSLVPIRPRSRGERDSLRTLPGSFASREVKIRPRSSQQLRTSPARRLRFSPRARASLSIYYRQTAPPFNSDRRRSIRPSLRRTRG